MSGVRNWIPLVLIDGQEGTTEDKRDVIVKVEENPVTFVRRVAIEYSDGTCHYYKLGGLSSEL